jgi:hypothetical protein
MSIVPEELEDEPEDQPRMVQMARKDIRALERQAKAGDEARREAEAAKRELAFLKAGIPETGPGKLFVKAYDGELSAEAIHEAAMEYGIIAEEPSVSDDELAVHTRMTNTASGASPSTGKVDITAELNAAKSQSEVMEIVRKYDLRLPVENR